MFQLGAKDPREVFERALTGRPKEVSSSTKFLMLRMSPGPLSVINSWDERLYRCNGVCFCR